MRGNGNRNASRLKSYGRFLNGFCAWLRNGDFIENRENGAGIKKAEIGAERQLSPTLCCALRTALNHRQINLKM